MADDKCFFFLSIYSSFSINTDVFAVGCIYKGYREAILRPGRK